jgi:competence protein ComEC
MQPSVISRKSPFALFLIFYIAGIYLAAFTPVLPDLLIIALVLVLGIFLVFLHLFFCRNPRFYTGSICGFLTSLIILILGFSNMKIQEQSDNLAIQSANFSGTALIEIIEPAVRTKKTVKVTAVIREHKCVKNRQRILAYFEIDSGSLNLVPGNMVIARLKLIPVPPPDNPGEFNYRNYLASRKIYSQTYLKSGYWELADQSPRKSFKSLSYNMQQSLLNQYRKIGLDNSLYSLLSALTLGYKNDLEVQTKKVFARAGVMHVMALSGFNVAVIAFVLNYLFIFCDRIKYGHILKNTIIILVIWMFAFISGLSPSVTRAAVMISLVLIGTLIQRRINTANILYVSAFVLLTISPGMIKDISFQLSFSAVFGIMFFQPILYALICFKGFLLNKIWQLFTVAFAAQLSTLPLTLFYFNQFPLYFWLTNLYVVPLVSVIICVAGIFLALSFINPLVPVLGKMLAILLSVLFGSVSSVELLPYALIENIRINALQMIIISGMILSFGLFMIKRNSRYLFAVMSLLILMLCFSIYNNYTWNRQRILMVGNLKGESVIHIIAGRQCIFLSDGKASSDESMMQYLFGKFWIGHGITDPIKHKNKLLPSDNEHPGLGNNNLFSFCGKRVLVLKDESMLRWKPREPLKIDFLIISNNMKPDIDKLLKTIDPGLAVIDSKTKWNQSEKWRKLLGEKNIDCWSVREQGAFVYEFE